MLRESRGMPSRGGVEQSPETQSRTAFKGKGTTFKGKGTAFKGKGTAFKGKET